MLRENEPIGGGYYRDKNMDTLWCRVIGFVMDKNIYLVWEREGLLQTELDS